MKQLFITFLCLLLTAASYSQEEVADTSMKSHTKLSLGLGHVDIAYEFPLSKKFLMEAGAGIGAGYDVESNSMKWMLFMFEEPSISLFANAKWMYDRDKRSSLSMNAGNFVGAQLKYSSEGLFTDYPEAFNTLLFSTHWGLQRPLGKHWQLTFFVGLGYAYNLDRQEGMVYPSFDVKFSYVFPW